MSYSLTMIWPAGPYRTVPATRPTVIGRVVDSLRREQPPPAAAGEERENKKPRHDNTDPVLTAPNNQQLYRIRKVLIKPIVLSNQDEIRNRVDKIFQILNVNPTSRMFNHTEHCLYMVYLTITRISIREYHEEIIQQLIYNYFRLELSFPLSRTDSRITFPVFPRKKFKNLLNSLDIYGAYLCLKNYLKKEELIEVVGDLREYNNFRRHFEAISKDKYSYFIPVSSVSDILYKILSVNFRDTVYRRTPIYQSQLITTTFKIHTEIRICYICSMLNSVLEGNNTIQEELKPFIEFEYEDNLNENQKKQLINNTVNVLKQLTNKKNLTLRRDIGEEITLDVIINRVTRYTATKIYDLIETNSNPSSSLGKDFIVYEITEFLRDSGNLRPRNEFALINNILSLWR
jgi:hypothetical protein